MCFIKPTICMTSYEFSVTSQPLFLTSNNCIHDIISTLFLTWHPLYTTWHTLYLWLDSHCNYDKTPTMFLTLYSLYMTSHMVNEWKHIDSIWHDTHCICLIRTIDWWHHTLCMYEITPTAYMTPYAFYMTSHPLLLTTHHCLYLMAYTLFMTSYVLYMMSPILCVWLHKLYICLETH